MPGTRTSIPYCARPETIAGPSTRFTGVPRSANADGAFNAGAAGDRHARGIGGQRPEAASASRRRVDHVAEGRLARRGIDIPGRGSGADQHFACGGSGDPKTTVGSRAAAATAGVQLNSLETRSWRRLLDDHARPVRAELLGEDHREERAHALPHLQVGDPQGHRSIAGDLKVGVRLERRARRLDGEQLREGWNVRVRPAAAAVACRNWRRVPLNALLRPRGAPRRAVACKYHSGRYDRRTRDRYQRSTASRCDRAARPPP